MSERRLRLSMFGAIAIGSTLILSFLWVMHINQPEDIRSILNDAIVILFLCTIATLGIFCFKFNILNAKGQLEKHYILILVSTLLLITQLTFLSINCAYKELYYLDKVRGDSLRIYQQMYSDGFIQKSLEEYELEKDRNVSNDPFIAQLFIPLRKVFVDYVHQFESIKHISLSDQYYQVLLSSDHTEEGTFSENELMDAHFFPILIEDNIYYLSVHQDESIHYTFLRETVLKLFSVLVICVFFTLELLSFILKWLENKIAPQEIIEGKEPSQILDYIRPLTFIFFFATMMPYAFIPIMAEEMKASFWGLSADILVSMSVTATILFTCIAIFTTSWWVEKKGWKYPFLFGVTLNLIGDFLSAFAPNLLWFIGARALVGIGYGFCWMTLRNISLFGRNPAEKKQAFAFMLAGLFAGMNCGIILGTTLVESLGYQKIFFVGNILMILCILFALGLKNQVYVRPLVVQENRVGEKIPASSWQFFYLVLFVVLIILPTSVASSFTTYFLPLYLYKTGYDIADVGRMQLFQGVIIVYLGPYLARLRDDKKWTFIHNLLIGSALVLFGVLDSFWAAVVAVSLLGLAASFGTVMQNAYFFKFRILQARGEGMSLSWLSFIRKITEAAAPAIFASFMFLESYGVALIGMISIVAVCAYFIFVGKRIDLA